MITKISRLAPLLLVATLFTSATDANSPDALLTALDRLDTDTPVRVSVQSELWRAEGTGDDRETYTTDTQLYLAHDREGLSLEYSPTLLKQLDEESDRKIHHPDMATPVNDFTWRLHLSGLRPLVFPARSLRRSVKNARFRESEPDDYDGRTVTRLIFDRDKSVVHERIRRYIKEFESTLEVWVTEDGTPLASRVQLDARGSILFVIRGEHHEERVDHYTIERGRLLVHQHEEWQKTDVPREHHESRLNHQLSVLPPP